jgi:hypothetical protein
MIVYERYGGCSAAAVGARLGQLLGPMLLVLLVMTWRWRARRGGWRA